MNTMLIILGVILILSGILTIVKKWMWLQQGLYKRPVRVKEYMRYMGTIDIICGLVWICAGVINYGKPINDGMVFLSLCVFFVLIIFGEIRFHEKKSMH